MGATYEWVVSLLFGDKCPRCPNRYRNLLLHASHFHPGQVSD